MPRTHVRHNRTVRRRRASSQRGAALIEAALVLPVLIILVFGIIDIGLLIDSATVASNASRNGARMAAANYGDTTTSGERTAVLNTVRASVEESLNGLRGNVEPVEMWVYEANAAGYPSGTGFTSCSSSCIRYTWNGSGFGNPVGSWNDPKACGTALDRVGVYVRVRHGFLTPLIGAEKTLQEHTVMRIEPRTQC